MGRRLSLGGYINLLKISPGQGGRENAPDVPMGKEVR